MKSIRRQTAGREFVQLLCHASVAVALLFALPPSLARTAQEPVDSPADHALQAALKASQREDLPALQDQAKHIPASHPLSAYVQYWQLRLQLRALDKSNDAPSQDLGERTEAFIATHDGSLVGDLMRRQWLLVLGNHARWAEFNQHLPHWQRRFDTRVFCYAGLANLYRGDAVGEQAMHAFQTDRDLGQACGALTNALVDHGQLTRSAIRARLWRAIEVRDWASVRLLAGLLDVRETWIKPLITHPKRIIRELDAGPGPLADADRDALVIALARLAGPEPLRTATRLREADRLLNAQDRSFLWSQLAASAMRDMLDEADEFAGLAHDARITDVTRRWLIRVALREQDWPMVLRQISLLSSEGQADPTWVYWRARALSALGSRYGARALFKKIAGRHDFYGELAAEALGQAISAPNRSGQAPSADDMRAIRKLPGIARALKFYELDMRYRGNREWNFAVRGLDDRQLLAAATWACQDGLLERCISTAERTSGHHDFALRFIRPFERKLAPLASRRGLELAWIYGLIRQESRFMADARSVAGARGLMQIMPATGRWIARRLGVSGFRTRHLYEPATNLRFGTYYMKVVLDDLRQSPLLASAAYNAGPKRARRWVASLPADVDGALFTEIIPFHQTRAYVKKVLLNTAYYGAILDGAPQSLTALLGTVVAADHGETDIP